MMAGKFSRAKSPRTTRRDRYADAGEQALMRILALHDGGSGCCLKCWWRVMVPLGELAKHDGFEVEYKTAGDQGPEKGHAVSVTQRDLEGYDVIVGQRFNHHSGLQVWRKAR